LNQKDIILTTFNARYSHSSFALRYIYANLHEYQEKTKILEFVIKTDIETTAEKILNFKPKLVGISTYIWNANEVSHLIKIIKKVSPQTIIFLGGPEVSYEPFRVDLDMADFIIKGEGEVSVYELIKNFYTNTLPKHKIIPPQMVDLKTIKLPYEYYTDEDVKNRHIYIEMSRGCPYLCEFCLSSLDNKMRYFDLDIMLEEIEKLWQRGVRNFKFVDRTFNLNMKYAVKLLDYFLSKKEQYFLHFEVIPDNFPERLLEKLRAFPKGSLQLEVGIQTLTPATGDRISRPLNLEKIEHNITYLSTHTTAHMHLDLILGLPGQTLDEIQHDLNKLMSFSSCEIQVGILKKLSGTDIKRHDELYKMVYSDMPPYDILSTSTLDFSTMQKLKRFARFWDIYYNSGNFNQSIKLLFENDVYTNFMEFSAYVYTINEATFKISLDRAGKFLFDYLVEFKSLDKKTVAHAIANDTLKIRGRKPAKWLIPHIKDLIIEQKEIDKALKRQAMHE
jgi:radical SAM superfamily enzyme YgiQ (UPF0313 family)